MPWSQQRWIHQWIVVINLNGPNGSRPKSTRISIHDHATVTDSKATLSVSVTESVSVTSVRAMCLYLDNHTVVPALGDPRRERTPAMYGHVINVPTHFNVKLPAIGGHLPNADADSHLLVVRTCYNGQFKQMPRFRRSFQPKIARGGHPNLRPTFCSNVHAAIW